MSALFSIVWQFLAAFFITASAAPLCHVQLHAQREVTESRTRLWFRRCRAGDQKLTERKPQVSLLTLRDSWALTDCSI